MEEQLDPNRKLKRIQIREEEKRIKKKYFCEALGMNELRLCEILSHGKFNNLNDKFLLNQFQIKDIMIEHELQINIDTKKIQMPYYNDLTAFPFLKTYDKGIWLGTKIDKEYIDNCKETSWNQQGGSNHIHIKDIVKNPVMQLVIADKIISMWLKAAMFLNDIDDIVIYQNGIFDSTICVYMMPSIDEKFLKSFDSFLRIRKCIVTDINFFCQRHDILLKLISRQKAARGFPGTPGSSPASSVTD